MRFKGKCRAALSDINSGATIYLSQFWSLEVQDSGAGRCGVWSRHVLLEDTHELTAASLVRGGQRGKGVSELSGLQV